MKKLNLMQKRNNTVNSSDNKDMKQKKSNKKIEEIKDALLNNENSNGNNLINITEL